MIREGWKLNKRNFLREIPWQHQGVKWKDSRLLLSWKHRLFQPKSAPFEDRPMKVQLMLTWMPGTTVPHPEPIGMQWLITVRKEDQKLNIILRKKQIVYISNWWSRSAESFPSNGFLGCPLGCLMFWGLICYDCRGSLSVSFFNVGAVDPIL